MAVNASHDFPYASGESIMHKYFGYGEVYLCSDEVIWVKFVSRRNLVELSLDVAPIERTPKRPVESRVIEARDFSKSGQAERAGRETVRMQKPTQPGQPTHEININVDEANLILVLQRQGWTRLR